MACLFYIPYKFDASFSSPVISGIDCLKTFAYIHK